MRRRPILRQEESASIRLADRLVPYTLKRSSARRTLALRVHESGQVLVNAPLRLAQRHIEGFILQHADWLVERLARPVAVPLWHAGMELPFLGARITLAGHGERAGGGGIWLEGDRLLYPGTTGDLSAAVTAWYQAQAKLHLAQRLAILSRGHGRVEPPWRLSDARSRWGSLSPKGVVSLNWRLMKASSAEIDYVICHELAHFRQRNHSTAFWRQVEVLFPDYANARARLRENSRLYFEF